MPTLTLWDEYDRRAVHDIFEPTTTFTPQSGTWGLQGIVRVAETDEYVFYVTFGQTQGTHAFDESISTDGVLTWQSQPQMRLDHPRTKRLIAHDELNSNIHLFLRTSNDRLYTYMGRLGYLSHDPTREEPVYFRWQLLDAPLRLDVSQRLRLEFAPPTEPVGPLTTSPNTLIETSPPAAKGTGSGGGGWQSKHAYRPGRDARNHKLGLAGEKLVLLHETNRLEVAGRHDLAEKIVHVSLVEGDGAGYDIRSFNLDGSAKHIEVKTTKGPASNAFFISPKEADFSEKHPDSYVLIRVFGYDAKTNSGNFYQRLGDVHEHFDLTPSEFRARLAP